MQSTLWSWVTAIGMNLSIFTFFSLAYALAYTLRSPALLRLVSGGNFIYVLVNLNILLWMLIATWRIGKDLQFEPFRWKGLENEISTFIAAFFGLHLLNVLVKTFFSSIRTAPPPDSKFMHLFATPIFGALEEIIWRGYVLNSLGGPLGYVVSSVGFGLHHLGSSWQHALFATTAGLILGAAYWKFGGLWGVFLAHGLYNLSIVVKDIFKEAIK
ncbi:MAG: CPBP family intramembrane metalloprotease [Thermotogae bacterium]|nr:CPBP family intramembrane metalloprotease [Thermotogota bacterium]